MLYLPIVSLSYLEFAGGGWLDVYEIYFTPLIAFSIIFFFYSFALFNPLPKFHTVMLNSTFTVGMILAIPNISYYVGTTGYLALVAAWGNLSITMMIFNALHYFSRIFIRKKANKSGNKPESR